MAAALASRGGGGAGGGAAGVTKNRLRTSHFLRTVWWNRGEGREVWERISARAAQMLGLPPSSAEAPQIVCYPGGLSYFRPHHDSGRLLSSSSSPPSDPQAHDSSSSSDSSDDDDDDGGGGAGNAPAGDGSGDGAAWVELDRDHYGAARVATVFVYLSSHAPADGGATCFSKLAGPVRRPSLRLTVTAHRHPAPPRATVLCGGSCEMCLLVLARVATWGYQSAACEPLGLASFVRCRMTSRHRLSASHHRPARARSGRTSAEMAPPTPAWWWVLSCHVMSAIILMICAPINLHPAGATSRCLCLMCCAAG